MSIQCGFRRARPKGVGAAAELAAADNLNKSDERHNSPTANVIDDDTTSNPLDIFDEMYAELYSE